MQVTNSCRLIPECTFGLLNSAPLIAVLQGEPRATLSSTLLGVPSWFSSAKSRLDQGRPGVSDVFGGCAEVPCDAWVGIVVAAAAAPTAAAALPWLTCDKEQHWM